MKKVLTFVLALMVGAGTVFAESGVCGADGDNLAWDLTGGVLTVSGTGAMADYASATPAPWDAYKASINSVVVNNGVTTVGNYAFYNIDAMTSVTMPNSVTTVGKYAFYGCDGLTAIEIPKGITSVGYRALDNCAHLSAVVWNAKKCNYKFEYPSHIKSYTFGEEVETLATSCCDGMSELTSIVIPNSVTSIGYRAFTGCSKLASVTIGNSVTSIGDEVFWNCTALTSIEIPNSVTSIGSWVFKGCSALSTVTMGSSIASLGEQVFYNLESLAKVTCKAVVPPTLGNECFKYASRYDLLVPAGSEDAYAEAWTQSQWKSIDAIADPYLASGTCGTNLTWTLSYSGVLTISGTGAMTDWSSAAAVPWSGEHAAVKSVAIGSGVTSIGGYAFHKFTGLTEITIPENIATIGTHAFADCTGLVTMTCDAVNPPACGTDAFAGVSSGLKVLVPAESVAKYNGVEPWKDLKVTKIPVPHGTCGENLTWSYKDSVLTISGMGVMEWDGFAPWDSYNDSIYTAVIEAGAVNIDSAAFYYYMKLQSVSLPGTIDSIGYLAFGACFNIKTLTLPKSVTKLGAYAFWYCMGLESITCQAATPPDCGEGCFSGVDTETTIVYVPNGTLEKYKNAEGWKDFKNIQVDPIVASGTCGAEGDNLTWSLNIDSLLTISGTGDMADNVSSWIPYRSAIKFVAIESGATSIGNEAFADCPKLMSVTIPATVSAIGNAAFRGCSSLPAVVLPADIQTIRTATFYGCTGLTEFTIPATVTEIGRYAFADCSGLSTITIPRKVAQIGEMAFSGCTGLSSIESKAVTPPDCGTDCFLNVTKSIPVYVYEEAFGDYKKAQVWKEFTNLTAVACDLGSGTFGSSNQFTWRLTCAGTLYVDGTGKIDYGSAAAPWKDYASSVVSIELSQGITALSVSNYFSNLENLESVSLPTTLKSIANCFNFCRNLTTLSVPNSVTEIESSFNNCSGLTTVVLGYGLKTMHESFMGSLASPSSVTCFAVTPPGNLQNSFKGGNPDALYVPVESLSKYKEYHAGWGYFTIGRLTDRPETRIIDSGTAGAKITWTLDSNGILTIKGSGIMDKWGKPAPASAGQRRMAAESSAAPWYAYHDNIYYIVLDEGITTIGDYAFYGCTEVQAITCHAATPPTCGVEVFGGINTSILLAVPENNIAAYQGANQWQDFLDIEPIDPTATAVEVVDNGQLPVDIQKILRDGQIFIIREGKVYTLTGQEVR